MALIEGQNGFVSVDRAAMAFRVEGSVPPVEPQVRSLEDFVKTPDFQAMQKAVLKAQGKKAH